MRTYVVDSGLRSRPRKFPLGGALIALILVAAAVQLARHKPQTPAPIQATAEPAAWTEIPHPLAAFDLAAPELANSPLFYEARRNRTGGRQDILTFGAFGGEVPFVRLTLYRAGTEPEPRDSLFVDLARSAATAGLAVTRSLAPSELSTRFGPFEVSDIDLAAADTSTPCLGFLGAGLGGRFRISGFACGAPRAPWSRPALACLIDRLDLDSASDDAELADFFAASELRRNRTCPGTGLVPTPSQITWIDQNDAPPPLRLRKAH
ncbi:MAG TPA: hypothetical protein VKV77_05935 [Methylovirgula sp.]|nr:hypothetical protein [Methylovirgula sp.]